MRYAAARLLGVGGGNGGRPPSFVGGNGASKAANVTSRSSSLAGSNGSHSMLLSNYDGKGSYLIFNVGDTLFFSDLNSPDKVIGILRAVVFGDIWVSGLEFMLMVRFFIFRIL